jgi:hypothetical protein
MNGLVVEILAIVGAGGYDAYKVGGGSIENFMKMLIADAGLIIVLGVLYTFSENLALAFGALIIIGELLMSTKGLKETEKA